MRYKSLHVVTCRYMSLCVVICRYMLLCVVICRYMSLCVVICRYMSLHVVICRYMSHISLNRVSTHWRVGSEEEQRRKQEVLEERVAYRCVLNENMDARRLLGERERDRLQRQVC